MTRIGHFPRTVSSTWKYGLIGGLASLPFTTASYWQTGSELSLTPVFFGGILAAYFAERRMGTSSGVGFRAGLVGALPIIWVLFDLFGALSWLAGPSWFVTLGTILMASFMTAFALLGFGLAGFAGKVGGKIGSWIAGSDSRRQPPSISS